MSAPLSVNENALRERIERLEALVALLSGGGAGAGTFAGPIVADEVAAQGLILANGEQVFVLTHRSIWTKKNGVPGVTAPPLKAHEVLATTDGTGVITRTTYSDPVWRNGISDIYFDPANVTGVADDQAQAFFLAPQIGPARLPVRTAQEILRRIGRRNTFTFTDPIVGGPRIHILSSMDPLSDDRFELDMICGFDTFVRVLGEANMVLLAGVLDGVGGFTPQNPVFPSPSAWFFQAATATYQPAAGPLACSWANLAAAQPGGFGGAAHEPGNDAHINHQLSP